jgi:hypothetical protein
LEYGVEARGAGEEEAGTTKKMGSPSLVVSFRNGSNFRAFFSWCSMDVTTEDQTMTARQTNCDDKGIDRSYQYRSIDQSMIDHNRLYILDGYDVMDVDIS